MSDSRIRTIAWKVFQVLTPLTVLLVSTQRWVATRYILAIGCVVLATPLLLFMCVPEWYFAVERWAFTYAPPKLVRVITFDE